MDKWQKIHQMFPGGIVPNLPGTPLEEMPYTDYEYVQYNQSTLARNMLTSVTALIWDGINNTFKKESLYKVQPDDIDGTSGLSVYGNRMLLDYYERNYIESGRPKAPLQNLDIIINKEKHEEENISNDQDGFNYTGL